MNICYSKEHYHVKSEPNISYHNEPCRNQILQKMGKDKDQ